MDDHVEKRGSTVSQISIDVLCSMRTLHYQSKRATLEEIKWKITMCQLHMKDILRAQIVMIKNVGPLWNGKFDQLWYWLKYVPFSEHFKVGWNL
jgi:hypothetical protein